MPLSKNRTTNMSTSIGQDKPRVKKTLPFYMAMAISPLLPACHAMPKEWCLIAGAPNQNSYK
jgi:hypothetical protein